MRPWQTPLIVLCLLVSSLSLTAGSGEVIKVLPQYLDLKGQNSRSPSLYDRDAYQSYLRAHPNERSGLQFAVQWKAKDVAGASMKLRVELRGAKKGNLPSQTTLEQSVQQKGRLSHWINLKLTGEDYQKFGDLVAWRVTLWNGDQLCDEQKSFLW